MRKILSLLLFAMMTLTMTGCGSAWWTNFKKDPIAQTNAVIQSTQVVLAMANVVFQQVKVNLPVDKQVIAQKKYDAATLMVTRSLLAVRDALQTAADLKQDNPDMTKVLADLGAAVAGLQAVIDEFKNLVSAPLQASAGVAGAPPVAAPPAADVEGYDDLNAQIAKLKLQLSAK